MILTTKDLINLPVETKSGRLIGRVSDFEIETDSGLVTKFYVRQGNLIGGLLGRDLLIIGRNQVLSISKEKMVVEDGLIKEKNEERILGKIKKLDETEMMASSIKE